MSHDSPSAQTAPPIGVIIPTYNRAEVLLRCLGRLEEQTWRDFEVVVVDDGSTDDTRERVDAYAARSPLALRYVRQENSGPARARNRAISLLRASVCLMIGDDILPSPTLVETHLALHRRRPEPRVAALGLTRWSEEEQTVTPFMRWLDSDGLQFAYGELLGGATPTWRHFYTSNLSLKTSHLREHPFHESFRKAAMEDLELGYRLWKQDALEMAFLPEAVGFHLHPTTVAQACRRMVTVGAAGRQFAELWPEHGQLPPPRTLKGRIRSLTVERRWALPPLRAAAGLLARFWCPNPVLKRALLLHHSFGYREAASNAARRI